MMPTIVVNDLTHVVVGGVAVGDLISLVANCKLAKEPLAYGEILAAVQAWHDGLMATHHGACELLSTDHAQALAVCEATCAQQLADRDAAHAAAIAEMEAGVANSLADMTTKHAAEIAKRDEEASQYRKLIAEQQTQLNAMGGTEQAQRLIRAAECQAARDQIAVAQAVLAAHSDEAPS